MPRDFLPSIEFVCSDIRGLPLPFDLIHLRAVIEAPLKCALQRSPRAPRSSKPSVLAGMYHWAAKGTFPEKSGGSRSFPIDLSSLWSKPTRIGFRSKRV
jgi:hypothetical protein